MASVPTVYQHGAHHSTACDGGHCRYHDDAPEPLLPSPTPRALNLGASLAFGKDWGSLASERAGWSGGQGEERRDGGGRGDGGLEEV